MKIIEFNLKRFSSSSLTTLFFYCKPELILFNKFMVRLICHQKPQIFISSSYKELKTIKLEGWQTRPFKLKNNNYHVEGWN
jgi:hypothetical protein